MDVVQERLRSALADRYLLESELGQGGMATVYRARDLKHDRPVALKVLRPELAAVLGAERFVQEIKTTASLQHPHILPLFDSGSADGFLFYVMPYIQGETLRDKLNRETQLSVEEAVRLTREVADALDYAHRHGVIHRDIKPENILLHDGRPMVADFGIALAVSAAAGGRLTETGLSLGTPHYMSPEQATAAKEITARSDIYSLGSVLYEMLAGQPPHLGGSAQQIIMKIIAEPVQPVTTHRKSVPAHVVAAVAQALEKLPADRFESAKAFAEALGNPAYTNAAFTGAATAAGRGAGRVFTRSFVAMSLLTTVALAGWAWSATRPGPQPLVVRFELGLPDGVSVNTGPGTKLAMSRDGTKILILGTGATTALYLRRIDEPGAHLVRGSEGASGPETGVSPTFSPDGEWIAFSSGGVLKKLPVAGGAAQTIADSGSVASWGDRGTVVYTRGVFARSTLWLGSAEGRDARRLAVPDTAHGVFALKWPHVLPGGTAALITIDHARGLVTVDSLRIGWVSLKDGVVTDLGLAGTNAHYVATGHLVFGRSGGLVYAAPFSLRKMAVTGPARLLLDGVWQGSAGATGFAASDNGTLVYHEGASGGDRELVVVDRNGAERAVPGGPATLAFPRLSPDARRAVFGSNFSLDGALWLVDLASGARERLTDERGGARGAWSRDGARVLFFRSGNSGRREIVSRAWDRSADDQVLGQDSTRVLSEIAVGPSHGFSVVRGLVASNDLFIAPSDTLGALRPVVATSANELQPAISADGRLLAYTSDESGGLEIYVQPIPGPGARVQVSVNGGSEPLWSARGTTVYYRGRSRIMVANLGGSPLGVVRRDSLFVDGYPRAAAHQTWDVFPDGRHFLMTREPLESKNAIVVVLNWPQLRAPAAVANTER